MEAVADLIGGANAPGAGDPGAPTPARRRESYEQLVERLSVQSVKKHYRAYEDIDWDAPHNAIRRDDPRFELAPDEGLGATEWYRSQPAAVRAEIGLTGIVSSMKVGVVFENVLQRGMLEFAFRLPNRSPEFRYAYHEVIEEGHHSLMFQEFINRSRLDPHGVDRMTELGTRFVVSLGRRFPELFFFFVLGGEEPIDFAQKRSLRSGKEHHPLLEQIMKIHITEEARHLCFARNYLQRNVPELGWLARQRLAYMIPVILGEMAAMMLEPGPAMIRRFQIPASVIREAYHDSREHRRRVRASLASVAELCIELDLLTARNVWFWKLRGLGNPLSAPAARSGGTRRPSPSE